MLAQDERLVRRVGGVSCAVIALAIGFFVFVYDRIDWGSHIHVRVFFHATGGLREGAPFVVGGREVGRVETIMPVPHGAKSPLDGDEGVVATVAVDPDLHLRTGDFFVGAHGALSGKFLEIAPAADDAPLLREGDAVLGKEPPTADRVIERTWNNLQTMRKFAADIKPELDALRTQISELGKARDLVPNVDRMGALIDDTFEIAADIRRARDHMDLPAAGALVDRVRAMVGDARGKLAALGASADQLGAALETARARLGVKGPELAAKIDDTIDRVRAMIAKVDPLLAEIDQLDALIDEGSAMKIMHDPEFPEDAKDLGKILKRQPWRIIDRPPH